MIVSQAPCKGYSLQDDIVGGMDVDIQDFFPKGKFKSINNLLVSEANNNSEDYCEDNNGGLYEDFNTFWHER